MYHRTLSTGAVSILPYPRLLGVTNYSDIFLAPLGHSLAVFAIIFSLKVFGNKG